MWRPILVLVVLVPNAASAQRVVGRIIEAGWGSPLSEVQVWFPDQNRGALTNDSGDFETQGVDAGSTSLRAELLCMTAIDTVVVVPESGALDLGTLVMQRHQPRMRLDHDGCRPTMEEDSVTRVLLDLAETNPQWTEAASVLSPGPLPVWSEWLRGDRTIGLFGVTRRTLPFEAVPLPGIICGVPCPESPQHLEVLRAGGPTSAVLSVNWRGSSQQRARLVSAYFSSGPDGWMLERVERH